MKKFFLIALMLLNLSISPSLQATLSKTQTDMITFGVGAYLGIIVSCGLYKLIQHIYPKTDKQILQEAQNVYDRVFTKHKDLLRIYVQKTCYPSTEALLSQYAIKSIAIVTSELQCSLASLHNQINSLKKRMYSMNGERFPFFKMQNLLHLSEELYENLKGLNVLLKKHTHYFESKELIERIQKQFNKALHLFAASDNTLYNTNGLIIIIVSTNNRYSFLSYHEEVTNALRSIKKQHHKLRNYPLLRHALHNIKTLLKRIAIIIVNHPLYRHDVNQKNHDTLLENQRIQMQQYYTPNPWPNYPVTHQHNHYHSNQNVVQTQTVTIKTDPEKEKQSLPTQNTQAVASTPSTQKPTPSNPTTYFHPSAFAMR